MGKNTNKQKTQVAHTQELQLQAPAVKLAINQGNLSVGSPQAPQYHNINVIRIASLLPRLFSSHQSCCLASSLLWTTSLNPSPAPLEERNRKTYSSQTAETSVRHKVCRQLRPWFVLIHSEENTAAKDFPKIYPIGIRGKTAREIEGLSTCHSAQRKSSKMPLLWVLT